MPEPLAHSTPEGIANKNSSAFVLPDAAKLEAMAEFAAGAGHEINNPLATIIGRAQQLLKDERDPRRRQMIQAIGAQAYRIRDMIGDAMLFGRPPLPEIGEVELSSAITDVVTRLRDSLTESNCQVSDQVPLDLVIRADRTQLAILFAELIRNSRDALQPRGGEIQIRARTMDHQFVRVEVEDHGRGFTEAERVHAFDPFFSGRQAGRGLGFGLPKCWQIIRQHGGRIEIESIPDAATTVRIDWPVSENERPPST